MKDPNPLYILTKTIKKTFLKDESCVQDGFAEGINSAVALTYFRKIIKLIIISLTDMT